MNRSLIIALLQGTLQKPVSTTSVLEDSDSHENDPAFEWLSILFRVLFQAGYYKALYNSIGAHLLSKLWSRVTPEQLIFLRMFHMYIQSNAKEAKEELIRDALPIFQFSKNAYLYILSSENDDRPEEVDEARKIMWVALENEAKILFLEVLGEVTVYSSAWTTASSSEICHVEETSLLLEQILQELHRVWKARAEDVNMRDRLTNAVHGTIPEQFPSEPFGYRSALIRIIGNMCYHHAIHQDLVREKGFLPLILNHCNLDDTNPLVREWSLVALRNLCEENEANQQYIQSLRPQGVESKVDLSNTGMKPVLDKETNKPKLVSMEDQTIKKQ
jgi:ataxin-10